MIGGRIEPLARSEVLLVACDYDGTLTPIVGDPAAARVDRETTALLERLARLPRTHVAILSGRARAELATLCGAPAGVRLVGSHGAELDDALAETLDEAARDLRDALLGELSTIAATEPGALVEAKPAGAAFHYRLVTEERSPALIAKVHSGPARRQGVRVLEGKKVIELSVLDADKGRAFRHLREQTSATAALYLGDDRTDEDVFAVLDEADLGFKVGPGPTRATHRLADPREVRELLETLAAARSDRCDAAKGGR